MSLYERSYYQTLTTRLRALPAGALAGLVGGLCERNLRALAPFPRTDVEGPLFDQLVDEMWGIAGRETPSTALLDTLLDELYEMFSWLEPDHPEGNHPSVRVYGALAWGAELISRRSLTERSYQGFILEIQSLPKYLAHAARTQQVVRLPAMVDYDREDSERPEIAVELQFMLCAFDWAESMAATSGPVTRSSLAGRCAYPDPTYQEYYVNQGYPRRPSAR